jgi:hypothetical protein
MHPTQITLKTRKICNNKSKKEGKGGLTPCSFSEGKEE